MSIGDATARLYCLCTKQVDRALRTRHNRYKAMSNETEREANPSQRTIYQIRLKGHLGSQWAEWFEGLAVTLEEDGNTLLTGLVDDQAALHGLLKKIRDLGMPLISVGPVEPDGEEGHGT